MNFYPSGFYRLFGIPLHEFNGRMMPPKVLLGDRSDDLYAAMRRCDSPSEVLNVLHDFLNELVNGSQAERLSEMQELEKFIRECKGRVRVDELADRTGLSARQLQRRCLTELGLSPKAFCKVVRFNNAYAHMQRTGKFDLHIALECGYFDESHMLKELTYFLGRTPKRFATMSRPMVNGNLGH